ncbi:hypothetical protein F5J12DRAFT_779652 [Pisolithus orientalis]|uniref:uncharacterized protein n=1 Tax=Pisolithus orientalis TaxID=936130 RepID=UPI002224A90F|nr:uncharacterized protein F5J12DRAFT_779652 [Pisolithus orientalis]KAI6030511.1 hypothetical protein F5J12DRAFT_779652 [Pisolithus orientalis]
MHPQQLHPYGGVPPMTGTSSGLFKNNFTFSNSTQLPSQPSLLDDSSSEFSDFHQGVTYSHGHPKNTSFHPTMTIRSVSFSSLQYGTPTPDMAGIQNSSSELRALSKTVGQQSVTIEKLMTHLQTVEEEVAVLCAWMETQQDDHPESSRGRRAMKLYIHPLFADLCGIKRSLECGARALTLTNVKPLDTCEPFKQIDQKTCMWHPNFLGQVDDALNAKFIQEVAQHIWDNEMTQHQQTGKGELPDSDYGMPIIKECTKTYFQNVHKLESEQNDPCKLQKANDQKTITCQHTQHQGVGNNTTSEKRTYHKALRLQRCIELLPKPLKKIPNTRKQWH